VGCWCQAVPIGSVLGDPAVGASVRERSKELAGRLLNRCMLSASFAWKPGKLCEDVLTRGPIVASTSVREFGLPTVGNVVVFGNVGKIVDNVVGVPGVEHDDAPAQTSEKMRREDVGMHRKPSEGQSTTSEKNLRKG
jgi:hypothetical protein